VCLALSVLLLSAQTEYTADGSHSALEEEIRWLTNRGRFDTASENAARGTAYADVPASAGPLAPHESLSRAARRHSEDMAKNNLFQHDTVPGSAYYDPATHPRPWDRMRAEGYSGNRSGENIAAGYASAEAAYLGWWTSSGHRRNLCNAELREIGNGYLPQVTSDLVLWTGLAPGPQPGTGAEMTWTDPAPLTPPGFGFYRVLVTAL